MLAHLHFCALKEIISTGHCACRLWQRYRGSSIGADMKGTCFILLTRGTVFKFLASVKVSTTRLTFIKQSFKFMKEFCGTRTLKINFSWLIVSRCLVHASTPVSRVCLYCNVTTDISSVSLHCLLLYTWQKVHRNIRQPLLSYIMKMLLKLPFKCAFKETLQHFWPW